MPLNPLTLSDTKTVNPFSPPEEKPALTDPEFAGAINKFLEEGIKNNHSQDYVAGQIYDLAQENPELAKEHSLTDYQAIKAGVKLAYDIDMGPGRRPVALGDASEFDLFRMGVDVEAGRQEAGKPLSDVEKQELEETGRVIQRDVMVLAGVTTAVVGGVALAPAVVRAGQWLMGVAATERGQHIMTKAQEFISGYTPGTSAPQTWTGFSGTLASKVVESKDDIADLFQLDPANHDQKVSSGE